MRIPLAYVRAKGCAFAVSPEAFIGTTPVERCSDYWAWRLGPKSTKRIAADPAEYRYAREAAKAVCKLFGWVVTR